MNIELLFKQFHFCFSFRRELQIMDRSQENNIAGMAKPPSNFRAMQPGKAIINNHRKPLGDIGNFAFSHHPFQPAVCKRGLPEKHVKNPSAGIEKNQSITAINRPVTRRFAATLATTTTINEQFYPQDINRKHALVENVPLESKHKRSSSNSWTDYEVIDSDKMNATNGFSLQTDPMVIEIEPMIQEKGKKLQEDEMELVMDIDSCDSGNPLAVVEYIEDIYCFYREIENSGQVCSDYMSNQTDINEKMRAILIDWLIEVHYKFELMDETLFLTVNLIDRFLACQNVMRKKLQLVGVTAMLIACKYEEVSVPVVEDLILISDRAYTKDEILDMEKLMVNTLQFKFSVPTPYVFMRRSLKAAQCDKKLELLSFYIIELCLVEYEMLKYSPSFLAAAAVYTAQCTIKGCKHWSSASEWHTNYSEDQLQECSKLMVGFHQKAGIGKLTGVHRKYNTLRFGFVAKAGPASFLLDP